MLAFCYGFVSGQLFQPALIIRKRNSETLWIFPSAWLLISGNSSQPLSYGPGYQNCSPGKSAGICSSRWIYIYRIKIEPFGFGQAIYIRHTNGYVSLYAHLNAFYPALAFYVKQKQYELQRWDISLDLPPGLFPVKKGDLIALQRKYGRL